MRINILLTVICGLATSILGGCSENDLGSSTLGVQESNGVMRVNSGGIPGETVSLTAEAWGHACGLNAKNVAEDRAEEKAIDKIQDAFAKQLADEARSGSVTLPDGTIWEFVEIGEPESDIYLVQEYLERYADASGGVYAIVSISNAVYEKLDERRSENCGWAVKVRATADAGIKVEH